MFSDEECWVIMSKMENLVSLIHFYPLNFEMDACSFKAFELVLSRLKVLTLGRPINFEGFTLDMVFQVERLWLLSDYWFTAAVACLLSYCPRLNFLVLSMGVRPEDYDRERVSLICRLRDEGKLSNLTQVVFVLRQSLCSGSLKEYLEVEAITSFLRFDKLEERGIVVLIGRQECKGIEVMNVMKKDECGEVDSQVLRDYRKYRRWLNEGDIAVFNEMHRRRKIRRRKSPLAKIISRSCRV